MLQQQNKTVQIVWEIMPNPTQSILGVIEEVTHVFYFTKAAANWQTDRQTEMML